MAGEIALLPKDARHHKVLMGFLNYCHDHPEERFWQALSNWSGYPRVLVETSNGHYDTFYWEGRVQSE